MDSSLLIIHGVISYKWFQKKREEKRKLLVPLLKCHIDYSTRLELFNGCTPPSPNPHYVEFPYFPVTVHQISMTMGDTKLIKWGLLTAQETLNVIPNFTVKKSMLEHEAITVVQPTRLRFQPLCCPRISQPDEKNVSGVIWTTACILSSSSSSSLKHQDQRRIAAADSTNSLFFLNNSLSSSSDKKKKNLNQQQQSTVDNDEPRHRYWLCPEDMDVSSFLIAFMANVNACNTPSGSSIYYELTKYDTQGGLMQGTCKCRDLEFYFARKILCQT